MVSMDQNIFLLWKRAIVRGMTTARRERRWLAAFGALFGILLILQLLLFGLMGVRTIQSLLEANTDLRLEIRPQATDQDIREFYIHLEAQPYVEKSVYITKEQAYEHTRENDPELIAFIEKFSLENPFTDTIGITLTTLDRYDEFTRFVQQPEWSGIVDPTFLSEVTNQEAQVHELIELTRAGRTIAMIVLLLTGCVLLFIVIELVRRRSLDRADEVFVEKLVGAHPLSIFVPFATEASILLWVSIATSMLVLVVMLALLPVLLPPTQGSGVLEVLGEDLTRRTRSFLPLSAAAQFLLAPVLAGFGAWLGVLPQLRAKTLSLHKE